MTQPATSKSFRAILFMRNEEIDRLRSYCESNFASSAVIQEDQPMVIWLATRDRKRTAQAHRRSARAVLEKLRIPVGKGKWLVLCTDEAVREAVLGADVVAVRFPDLDLWLTPAGPWMEAALAFERPRVRRSRPRARV